MSNSSFWILIVSLTVTAWFMSRISARDWARRLRARADRSTSCWPTSSPLCCCDRTVPMPGPPRSVMAWSNLLAGTRRTIVDDSCLPDEMLLELMNPP